MPESPAAPAQLFYSYSHRDEKLRDRLEVHLSALKREGLISGWHDRKIGAGTEWKDAIDDNLKSARIILLLVSADFLASDYCYDVELKYAMERHEKGHARVIPVILQPCDWDTSIFAKLQALPKDGKPVTKWNNRNDAFVNIAAGIRKALADMETDGLRIAVSNQAASTTVHVPAPTINALHGLPTPPADFTGRTAELAELLEAVKTGGVTISGLQGMGGVGKTALALKLANQLKNDYPDAQFYVDLKGVTQPLAPKEAMAHVIRAWNPVQQLPEKEEDIATIYRSVLDGKRALLLMDNARDVNQVRPLIPPTSCLLLVTSRIRFALPGLFEKDLNKLPAADASRLLLKIASRLEKEKKDVIENLADLCGYLPLALEKVANALKVKKNISAAGYAKRLSDARNRLKFTEIDAALQSSYDLLTANLQRSFRFLAVFPGTFDLAATGAVWEVSPETSQDAMGELLAYSLVEFDEVTERYNLHDLVRVFADQLLNAEERYSGQKRHAGHYLQVLEAANDLYLKGGESVTKGLALFDLEVTNVLAGHGWVVAHQRDDDTAAEWCWEYPNAGAYCLPLRQHPRERIRWLELALTSARRLQQREAECSTVGNLGIAYGNLGEYRRAIEYQEQALAIDRELGNHSGEGEDLGNLGNVYHYLGDYRRAIEYHEQSLAVAREIGDHRGESAALGNLGIAYKNMGEYRRAIEYNEQHLKIAREIGDRLGEGNALGNLGIAYKNLGEYRRAIEYNEQHLKIAREIGDRFGEGNALCNLGIAYSNLGEYRRAVEYYGQQLEIVREIGDRSGEAAALFNSAVVLHHLEEHPAAIARAEAALEISEAIESPHVSRILDKLVKWREEDKASG